MTSNKTYTQTKTLFGEKKSEAWWRLWQFRFKNNHPILSSTEKCASQLTTLLSQAEEQMLLGMTNSLQCEQREALRIAVSHLIKTEAIRLNAAREYSSPLTKKRGHTCRESKLSFKLPKSEKDEAQYKMNELGLSEKELVRLAIVFLEKGIRAETELPEGCIVISQKELSKQWQENNPEPKESKLKELKEAGQKAWDLAAAEGKANDEYNYAENGMWINVLKICGYGRQLFLKSEINWKYLNAMKCIYETPENLLQENLDYQASYLQSIKADRTVTPLEELPKGMQHLSRQEGEQSIDFYKRVMGEDRYEAYIKQFEDSDEKIKRSKDWETLKAKQNNDDTNNFIFPQ